MKLTGSQYKQVMEAFLSAFDYNDLRILTAYLLDEKLDRITYGTNLEEAVFDLIRWAESRGQIEDFISGAAGHRPNNPLMLRLREELPHWEAAAKNNPTLSSDPQAIFSEAFRLEYQGQYIRALRLYQQIQKDPELMLPVAERIAFVERAVEREKYGPPLSAGGPVMQRRPKSSRPSRLILVFAAVVGLGSCLLSFPFLELTQDRTVDVPTPIQTPTLHTTPLGSGFISPLSTPTITRTLVPSTVPANGTTP